MVEFDGSRWVINYLIADARLGEDSMRQLVIKSSLMYIMGEGSLDVEGSNFQGRITTNGRHQLIGPGVSGQCFKAELYTDFGKSNVAFLLMDANQYMASRNFMSNSEGVNSQN